MDNVPRRNESAENPLGSLPCRPKPNQSALPIDDSSSNQRRLHFAAEVDRFLSADGHVPLAARIRLLLHFHGEMETAYLHFSQLPDTLIHSFLALVMGVSMGLVFPFIIKFEVIPLLFIYVTVGAVLLGCSLLFAIFSKKKLYRGGVYSERFLFIIQLLWVLANVFAMREIPSFLVYSVDSRAWAALGGIAVTRPRFLPFTAVLMTISAALFPILRYASYPSSPYYGFMPMIVVQCLGLSAIFAVNDMNQRVEFLIHLRAKEAVRLAEANRQELNNALLAMVAEPVLQRLVKGETVADVCEATVLFSDIGFTAWSSRQSSPLDIIAMLNDMYRRFDSYLEVCRVEKVTTIGDAYWAASGIPTPQPDHTLCAVRFAVQMVRESLTMNRKYGFSGLRVGVAAGVVYGGIAGHEEIAYQLFGSISEEAEHMEQQAPVNGILLNAQASRDAALQSDVDICNGLTVCPLLPGAKEITSMPVWMASSRSGTPNESAASIISTSSSVAVDARRKYPPPWHPPPLRSFHLASSCRGKLFAGFFLLLPLGPTKLCAATNGTREGAIARPCSTTASGRSPKWSLGAPPPRVAPWTFRRRQAGRHLVGQCFCSLAPRRSPSSCGPSSL